MIAFTIKSLPCPIPKGVILPRPMPVPLIGISVTFYIRPAKALKSPALVFADPKNPYIEVINKVSTGKKNKIKIKRRSSSSTKEIFEIKGSDRYS